MYIFVLTISVGEKVHCEYILAIWKRQWGLVIKTEKVKNYAVIRTLINQLIILSWLMLLVSLLIDLGKVGLDQLNINYSPFFTFWVASSILSHTTFIRSTIEMLLLNCSAQQKIELGSCSKHVMLLSKAKLYWFISILSREY